MPNTYTDIVGAPPAPYKLAWFDWYRRLLDARLAACPLDRGDDLRVTGTLSPDATGRYSANGTYGGNAAYERSDGAYWIWWDAGETEWVISATKGDATNGWASGAAYIYTDPYSAQGTATGDATVLPSTLYVAASAAGDGSGVDAANAMTLADALTAMGNMGGGVRLRLKRGDEFVRTSSVDLDEDNVTLDSYGDADEPLPLIHCFDGTLLDADNEWTADNGGGSYPNRYKITGFNAGGGFADTVGWLRLTDQRLNPLRYRDSAVKVGTTDWSWYYDATGDVLWVNLGGTDPNTEDMEYTAGVDDYGIEITGANCRVQGIRVDGFGCIAAATTDKYTFRISPSASSTAVVVGCESYYGGRHQFEHYAFAESNSYAAIVGCRAGLTVSNGSSSGYGSYAGGGNTGRETLFHHCNQRFGYLPDEATEAGVTGCNWSNCHGADLALLVFYGCSTTYEDDDRIEHLTWSHGSLGIANPGTPGDNDDVSSLRVFLMNNVCDVPDVDGAAGMTAPVKTWCSNYFFRADNLGNTYSIDGRGWHVNCIYDVRLTGIDTTGFFMKPEATANAVHDARFFHCHFAMRSVMDNVRSWRFDLSSTYSEIGAHVRHNCIIAGDDSLSACETRDSGGDAGVLDGNAYYLVSDANDGYDTDSNAVELTERPEPKAVPDPDSRLVGAGADLTGDLGGRLEYDFYGRPRRSGSPTIGPVETVGWLRCGASAGLLRGVLGDR